MKIKFLLIFLLSNVLLAQKKYDVLENSQEKFKHFASQDGLMHNSIISITQDSLGYMWFGTNNGLYKYNGYEFKFYTNSPDDNQSLLNENVKAIYEDSQGNLWIGTLNGLCKYNRTNDNFERIFIDENNNKNEITDSVNCIYQDEDGIVWIGTRLGLYSIQTLADNQYNIGMIGYIGDESGISSNMIYTIVEDAQNQVWIGTNSGLNRMIKETDGTIHFKRYHKKAVEGFLLKNDNILDIVIDQSNVFWIATKKGLNRVFINPTTNRIVEDTTYSFASNKRGNNAITCVTLGKQNEIWCGTKTGGLVKYHTITKTHKQFKQEEIGPAKLRSNDISDLYVDVSGILWIGTQRGGLSKLNLEAKKIAHYQHDYFNDKSLSGNLINNIYEDSKENIWITTFSSGINRLVNKDGSVQFIKYRKATNHKKGLSSNKIFGFVEDNYGNYWVGTQNNGLNHIKCDNNKYSNKFQVKYYNENLIESNFPWDKITLLYKDKIGDIWVGSFGGSGLMRFTPKPFDAKSPVFHEYLHDPKNSNSISNNTISSIFEDSKGVLWVGTTRGGLNKIIRDATNTPVKFIHIVNEPHNKSSLSNNNVFSINEDSKGNIWIGTFGGGLNRIVKSERDAMNPKLERFTMEDGLPSNEIYGVLEDKSGNLWISSNNGISKFNFEKKIFTNLNTSDGLQDANFRKFAYLKDKKGLMYFGGINGVNVLDPDTTEENKYLPSTEIVDFRLLNKSVKPGEKILGTVILEKSIEKTKKITLENKHNTFGFEFSAMHYASPKQNQYAYMLEGFDKDWIYTNATQRFAAYSNLDAGIYTFKVKSSNNNYLWNETYKSIKVVVLPPIWRSWWAYLIYTAIIVLLMYLFRKYILIDQEYKNKLAVEKMEQEKIKEVNKIKLEFFTNISHEFKTPLTLLLGPLKELKEAKETTKKTKKTLELMERNANQLFRLINQIMEFRKVETKDLKLEPTQGDLVNFCREEVFSFKILADKKNINLTFESNEYSLGGLFDWDKMEKILNNLISNSVKYTGEGGNIKVVLSLLNKDEFSNDSNNRQPEFVRIVVQDTGQGIPQSQVALIFDRFYQIKNKTKTNSAGGSGIGLALTKSLVDLHKGKISVESTENKGSKFTVDLPLQLDQLTDAQPVKGVDESILTKHKLPNNSEKLLKPTSNVTTDLEESEKQKLTLLLVDDNPDMLSYIHDALEGHYKILKCLDGDKGLELALSEVPDLIISDVMMPKMNGIALCKHLKENDTTSHIPVILLTAKGSTEHRIEGIAVGADAYIPKPFEMKLLKIRISKLLNQREVLKDKFSSGNLKLDSEKVGINEMQKKILKKIESIIDENLSNSLFDVAALCQELGCSRMQLYRKMKSITGLSANEFIREYRIKKAAVYLRETDMRISEVLYEIGISNHSYFTKRFKEYFNQSPREYINEHRLK